MSSDQEQKSGISGAIPDLRTQIVSSVSPSLAESMTGPSAKHEGRIAFLTRLAPRLCGC